MNKKVVLSGNEINDLVEKYGVREIIGDHFPELSKVSYGEVFWVEVSSVVPFDEYAEGVRIELVLISRSACSFTGEDILTIGIYDGSSPIRQGDILFQLPNEFNDEIDKLVRDSRAISALVELEAAL